MLRFAAVIACGMVLVGCAGQQAGAPGEAPTAGTLPPNYRQIIVAKVKETFFDPYSIRDASISAPIKGQAFTGETASVCVRANAKNRMGGYTGLTPTAYVFNAGALSTVSTEYAGMLCASAVYEPFPEIEANTPAPPKQPPRAR